MISPECMEHVNRATVVFDLIGIGQGLVFGWMLAKWDSKKRQQKRNVDRS